MFDLDNIDAVETPENDLEEVVMGLIINSGQARSTAYGAEAGEAGRLCRSESDDGAVAPGAERGASRADPAYRKRRGRRENEGQPGAGACQDHLMTSMLARELVAELIELHEKVQ